MILAFEDSDQPGKDSGWSEASKNLSVVYGLGPTIHTLLDMIILNWVQKAKTSLLKPQTGLQSLKISLQSPQKTGSGLQEIQTGLLMLQANLQWYKKHHIKIF